MTGQARPYDAGSQTRVTPHSFQQLMRQPLSTAHPAGPRRRLPRVGLDAVQLVLF